MLEGKDSYTVIESFSYGGQAEIYKVKSSRGEPYIAKVYRQGKQNKYHFSGNDERLKKYIYTLNEALNSIHEAGLIHADIKPANMLWDKEKDIPVLSDFGSMTKGDATTETNRSITLADGKVSEGYLAPDAAAFAAVNTDGKVKIEVATKTDYFALGVSLCEMYVKDTNFRLFRSNQEIDIKLKDNKER